MTLHYKFPAIRHLDDVLPHIAGRDEFIRVDKDGGYTVINYVFQTSETFPAIDGDSTAILRECRGIIFDTATGAIKSRRYHKFFNLGERPDTTEIDVSRPHYVLDKLDGSMISPLEVGGGIRWVSKMGLTQVSMQAETFVQTRPEYQRFSERFLPFATPIFEWMSRDNRIVLDYGDDQLTLVALRHNVTGQYEPRESLERLAEEYGLPLVGAVSTALSSIGQFVDELRQREWVEGVVITFDDGHMVKIKTDWYVQLHRAKDQIARERHLIALILGNKLDDLLPALPEDDRDRVLKFASAINADLTVFGSLVYETMARARLDGWDRKKFALNSEEYLAPLRSCCFHMFDVMQDDIIGQARQWGRNFVARNLSSQAALERSRGVMATASWNEKEVTE